MGDAVRDAAEKPSRALHAQAPDDDQVRALLAGYRDDLPRRLSGPNVLLHVEIAGPVAVERGLQSDVGLKVGTGGGSRLLPWARERRLAIGDRDDVQGGAAQAGELYRSGERDVRRV